MPHDRAQIVTELELGIRYLQYRCPPLKGFAYEILWREHELGEYANICLVWEDEFREAPWHLIENAQRALQTFVSFRQLTGQSRPSRTRDGVQAEAVFYSS